MRIRDGDSSDPGWKKVGSGIRDKHPGSATLPSYSFLKKQHQDAAFLKVQHCSVCVLCDSLENLRQKLKLL
jgi:hypothetical protein